MQINTAAGPISSEALGATLTHEHLVADFSGWEADTRSPAPSRDEVVAICVDRIQELQAAGFSSLLDPCPSDLGRDPELYAEVASRTGFNILFATGIYHEQYAGAYWRWKINNDKRAAEYLTDMYVEELTNGIGPSRLKPAVIKLAIGVDPDSLFENRTIEAAANASNATGAPILAHTEGVGGDTMLAKLAGLGVPAHRIIVGHCDGSPDKAYHQRIIDGGAYISFDRFGLNNRLITDDDRVDFLHTVLEGGHVRQTLVSHDCTFCARRRMHTPGIAAMLEGHTSLHFSRVIVPKLHALGVSQATVDVILRDNPRRYFCDEAPERQAVGPRASTEPA